MIYLTKGQKLADNPSVVVYDSTGYYNDGDSIICASIGTPDEPACRYEAQYIAYGGMVYSIADPDELLEQIIKMDPNSLFGKTSKQVAVDRAVDKIVTQQSGAVDDGTGTTTPPTDVSTSTPALDTDTSTTTPPLDTSTTTAATSTTSTTTMPADVSTTTPPLDVSTTTPPLDTSTTTAATSTTSTTTMPADVSTTTPPLDTSTTTESSGSTSTTTPAADIATTTAIVEKIIDILSTSSK